MFIQALAGALVASGVFYVFTPRMPTYQINGIHLYDVSVSPYLSFDCHIRAGIEIENDNFFGAKIYSTFMNVYYSDWNGLLTSIGFVKEANVDESIRQSKWALLYSEAPRKNNRSTHHHQQQHDTSQRAFHESQSKNRTTTFKSGNKNITSNYSERDPFISILPRTVTISEANALSIFIQSITPRVYLNILLDFIKSGGSLNMLVSGVAHVQSSFGLPLTLGVVCDNSLSIWWRPLHITSTYCEVKSLSMGWKDLQRHAQILRHSTIKAYSEQGRTGVFTQPNELLKNITNLLTLSDLKITEL